MLQGKKVALRTIRPDELDVVYRLIANVNAKGPFWHLNFPSEQAFRREYAENGCWGETEGRMLILRNEAAGVWEATFDRSAILPSTRPFEGIVPEIPDYCGDPLPGDPVRPLSDYIGELLYFKGLDYQDGVEIGYEIFDASHYGKGYMTEALSLFCAWMFAVRPINRVQVNLMKGNTGSRRVAEKCGFVHEGTMRAATFHRGKYHDLELFSLLREDARSLESLLQE